MFLNQEMSWNIWEVHSLVDNYDLIDGVDHWISVQHLKKISVQPSLKRGLSPVSVKTTSRTVLSQLSHWLYYPGAAEIAIKHVWKVLLEG